MDNLNFTVLLAGLVTYMVTVLRNLPYQLFNYFKHYFGLSVSVTSYEYLPYLQLDTYIASIDKRVLRNNLNKHVVSRLDSNKIKNNSFGINFGSYNIMINKFTWMFIRKTKAEHATEGRQPEFIDISIVGLHQREEMQKIKKSMETDSEKNIYCIDKNNIYTPVVHKSFDDVFIKDKDILINYIEKWKSSKELFLKHGIIFKTGILLYGVPGTGKTTLVRAIATYLSMDINIINIGSYRNSSELESRLSQIRSNTIVLFEDIDCSVTKRDNDNNEVNDNTINICTLLNFLDGINSPRDVLFIATTNHRDKLDEAIIRDSRFDVQIEVGNLSRELAIQMCSNFNCDASKVLKDETFPINPSYLQGKILKQIIHK